MQAASPLSNEEVASATVAKLKLELKARVDGSRRSERPLVGLVAARLSGSRQWLGRLRRQLELRWLAREPTASDRRRRVTGRPPAAKLLLLAGALARVKICALLRARHACCWGGAFIQHTEGVEQSTERIRWG